jgi:hypothetical protein
MIQNRPPGNARKVAEMWRNEGKDFPKTCITFPGNLHHVSGKPEARFRKICNRLHVLRETRCTCCGNVLPIFRKFLSGDAGTETALRGETSGGTPDGFLRFNSLMANVCFDKSRAVAKQGTCHRESNVEMAGGRQPFYPKIRIFADKTNRNLRFAA